MDKVKITPKYTAREQRLRNRLEETSFQLAQQTELAGGYLLEVFSLKGQLEAAEQNERGALLTAKQYHNSWKEAEALIKEVKGTHALELEFLHDALGVPLKPHDTAPERLLGTAHRKSAAEALIKEIGELLVSLKRRRPPASQCIDELQAILKEHGHG